MEKCPISEPLPILYKSYLPGDFMIGSIMSQIYIFSGPLTFQKQPSDEPVDDLVMWFQNYQHILALGFTVKEINENTQLLPNITLGFHILNSYFLASWTYLASMEILSRKDKCIPNYRCGRHNKVMSTISGPNSDVSVHMTKILSTYKIPQIIYGSSPFTDDKTKNDFFYYMFPTATLQYMGILELLLHFKWTWIGVLAFDNIMDFVQNILPIFSQHGICLDFIETIPKMSFSGDIIESAMEWFETSRVVKGSTSNVIIVEGEIQTISILRIFFQFSEFYNVKVKMWVWILTAQMDFTSTSLQRTWGIDFLHAALSFEVHSNYPRGFQKFLQMKNPIFEKEDSFIRIFWKDAFNCYFTESPLEQDAESICSGQENLETLPRTIFDTRMSSNSYSIYNAVYILAHALHELRTSKSKERMMMKVASYDHLHNQPWQLHGFLGRAPFTNSAGENISFDENGKIISGFDIFNWVTFSNQSFRKVIVGKIEPKSSSSKLLNIQEDSILWPTSFNKERPYSRCNDHCQVGYRKTKMEGKPFCCYHCDPCPEGKMTNQKDMEDCFQCPEGQFANLNHDSCLPKLNVYLAYEEPLGASLATTGIVFSFLATLVLGIFIKYRDTPIVKANNRNITYILLISLVLSCLCCLLFIGQPEKVTCLLRQTTFGIIFSVAISCVLAKTTIVILAFMASVPGSEMRRWLGKGLDNCIMFSCSLIQILICTAWLAMSPPYPDADMNFVADEIILECNEGSTLFFYSVLLYLLFLALVGFVVAFQARKLPNSFNETRFISFSMLCFCCVWISFFPTYLSTKGKYMVAVEIFSILASSAGLLGCIFFPKCYIILLRPDLNNKRQLMKGKKEEN